MSRYLLPLIVLLVWGSLRGQNASETEIIREFYNLALRDQQGYRWLRELTEIGPRLSGSPQADQAVLRMQEICDSLGWQTQLQKVKVPRWQRGGPEKAGYYHSEGYQPLAVTALGGSVATPPRGLRAPVVEIRAMDALDSLDLSGKIAFFNIPMDPSFISTGFAYGTAVAQRWVGAVEASKRGAVGVLIRSLSSSVNDYPHTGSMTYLGAQRKIPAGALSTKAAESLSRALAAEPALEAELELHGQWLDSVYSYNLIADRPGVEKPEEYLLVSGHIDSWDLGTGAHDDGAGCAHALEAIYLLQKSGIETRRSLRLVLYMNEEFGLSGAKAYAQLSREKGWRHAVAIESDGGGFSPRGLSIQSSDSIVERIKRYRPLLEPYGIHQFASGGSGADIAQLGSEEIILIGLRPDNHRYFEVHHSALDVLEKVNARELEMGSATLAALLYLLDRDDLNLLRP